MIFIDIYIHTHRHIIYIYTYDESFGNQCSSSTGYEALVLKAAPKA